MDEVRPGYYAIIPADVRYDDRIPPNAKLLYGEISALINQDGFCYASNQYFAGIYGCTPVTVARLVTKLEDAGYIRRELEKDKSGQVVRRKLYLSVSMPDVQPLNNFDNTPQQNCGEGINKNDKETNTSITNIEKENKKEKADTQESRRVPLTETQLRELFVQWISSVAADYWTKNDKNTLYFALDGFYAPRANKKLEPARTKAAFTALSNRLVRYSAGSPAVMIDMLERATTAGWKSVFPLGGDRGGSNQAPDAGKQQEGVQYRCV